VPGTSKRHDGEMREPSGADDTDLTDDAGGDPVCWLNRLCPECGAMPTGGATTCWRCGADVPDVPADR
jgi:ribosomal protein S27AE